MIITLLVTTYTCHLLQKRDTFRSSNVLVDNNTEKTVGGVGQRMVQWQRLLDFCIQVNKYRTSARGTRHINNVDSAAPTITNECQKKFRMVP